MSGKVIPRLVVATLLVTTAGCSGTEDGSLGEARQAASTFANDKAAYDYFISKGLTNFQAAAVVGNLDQESGVDPTIHQAGGGVGRGIAQWSTGARWDTTDKDNVLQYATQQGQSATSLGLQLDFIWYELTTFSEYGLTQLKASTNLTDATTAFEDMFEGCVYANYPECALPSRINFAKSVFNAYGSNPGGGGGSGAGGNSGVGGAAGTANAGAAGATVGGGGGGGTSGGGAAGSNPGSAGSSTSAGTSSAGTSNAGASSAGASTAGASNAGGPGTAGSVGTAGGPATAGNTSSLGNTGLVGSGTNNDSSCSVSQPGGGTNNGSLYWLGALLGSSLGLLRRRLAPSPKTRS